MPEIDFAAHAAAMGAWSRKVASIAELESGLAEAAEIDRTTVLVIDTDPLISTEAGGHWWDVAVPEVSVRPQVNAARKEYEDALKGQRL
jgi:3D-(3,5/4)-trihydroxycyclohexane-1,2-dione acylhydrolase (decyclizing)